MKRMVIGNTDIDLWECEVGKVCEVKAEEYYNAEYWYTLIDEKGQEFDSPSIFWDDEIEATYLTPKEVREIILDSFHRKRSYSSYVGVESAKIILARCEKSYGDIFTEEQLLEVAKEYLDERDKKVIKEGDFTEEQLIKYLYDYYGENYDLDKEMAWYVLDNCRYEWKDTWFEKDMVRFAEWELLDRDGDF